MCVVAFFVEHVFFRARAVRFAEVPPSLEDDLSHFLPSFLSSLIIMPGHPQYGPFYLVKGLANGLSKFPWSFHSSNRTKAYISLLPVLAAYAQVCRVSTKRSLVKDLRKVDARVGKMV